MNVLFNGNEFDLKKLYEKYGSKIHGDVTIVYDVNPAWVVQFSKRGYDAILEFVKYLGFHSYDGFRFELDFVTEHIFEEPMFEFDSTTELTYHVHILKAYKE